MKNDEVKRLVVLPMFQGICQVRRGGLGGEEKPKDRGLERDCSGDCKACQCPFCEERKK